MKKVMISLSVCVLIVGLSQIKSQTVSAEKNEEHVSNSKGLINQTDGPISIGKQTSVDDETTLNTTETTNQQTKEDTDDSEIKKDVSGEDVANKIDQTFSVSELVDASPRASQIFVENEQQLIDGVAKGGFISIAASFPVTQRIPFNKDVVIFANGGSVTFNENGGFYSTTSDDVTITFNNITVNSDVSTINGGTTALVSGKGNITLNLIYLNYNATAGCPIVATENDESPVTVNLEGLCEISTTGSGAPDTTLLKNIKDIHVNDGAYIIINDSTTNEKGSDSEKDCFSLIKFWTGPSEKHQITTGERSVISLTSSKNILFDVDGSLTLDVEENSYFGYTSRNNQTSQTTSNNIIGQSGTKNAIAPFTINAQKGSETRFRTDEFQASFPFKEGAEVQVNAYTPEYVQFLSTNEDKPAISSDTTINFANKADTSGNDSPYVLGETPISSEAETRYPIKVGDNRFMTKGKEFQQVIYYKYIELVTLAATSSVDAKKSTVLNTLGGKYQPYNHVELIAVPTEISDVSDSSMAMAIADAKKDTTGKSGYYQSDEIAEGSDGKLSDINNAWAGKYYVYAKLSNTETGKMSDWVQANVEVEPYIGVSSKNQIYFSGGYSLSVSKTATLISEGNTDTALVFNSMAENEGSSKNVKLVDKTTTDSKQLQLNMTAKNDNNTTLWSPMLIGESSFEEKAILSPYWMESTKSQAVFSVNGHYSGPLGMNQIENVSYNVTMGVSQNK